MKNDALNFSRSSTRDVFLILVSFLLIFEMGMDNINREETMSDSHLAIWEKTNPPSISISGKLEQDGKILHLACVIKNTQSRPIYVFREENPLIRLDSGGKVNVISMMLEIPPWMFVVAPHIPPVTRLAVNQEIKIEASYHLPLQETHPYPPFPDFVRPVTSKDEVATQFQFVLGFFPEDDKNALFDGVQSGEQVPSYYELKRQFLAISQPVAISVPVRRPIWTRSSK